MARLLDELAARGFVAQMTDEQLPDLLEQRKVTLYAGFDPTADSLHLGHLLPIIAMAHFQRAGHRPLAVVGGATGMVGDPSGRSSERNLLSPDQVAAHVTAIQQQISRFLDFDTRAPRSAVMLNNHDWIGRMSFVDWLRDVGKLITVNTMMAKESVKARLQSEQGISFTEFSYMTMQAYDFVYLHRTFGCTLQIGGSDQWGNITAGTDMIRKVTGEKAYGMTLPLLMTSSGQKFGKSAGNAIWLSAQRTSVYEFYQYWIRTDDADAMRFLKLFTFLPLDQIEAIEGEHAQAPHLRTAQRHLAQQVTAMVHGDEALGRVERISAAMFKGQLASLDRQELSEAAAELPSLDLPRQQLQQGVGLIELLVKAGAAKSNGEARRLIKQGAANVNDQQQRDESMAVTTDHIIADAFVVLRSGKKNYFVVRVID